MFSKKRQQDFFLKVFVITSVIVFLIVTLIFLSYFANSNIAKSLQNDNDKIQVDTSKNKYFFNEEFDHKDPFTTKIPSLKNMLRGPIISEADPSIGDINSAVSMVIFSDFECEYCAKQEKILKEAVDKYKIQLIWKDYPGSDPKSRSYRAAVAARCAQKENAFWQYHDMLFSGEYPLDDSGFYAIAKKLNLDSDDFAKCLSNSSAAGLINDNIQEAVALDIGGVPFLYVNDQEVLGEIEKEDLEDLIEIEIKK